MRAAPDHGSIDLTFFVERSPGGRTVAAALRAEHVRVEEHHDHFDQDCADDVWLPEVGRRGWVVLTRDREIRYRRTEIEAVRNTHVALFVLRAKNLRAIDMRACFVKALPAMLRLLARQRRPFVAHVNRAGTVELRDTFGK